MTSGLRSLRDKSLTYFDEAMERRGRGFDRLFKALNCYAAQVRRVAEEDIKLSTDWWQDRLRDNVNRLPSAWSDPFLREAGAPAGPVGTQPAAGTGPGPGRLRVVRPGRKAG